VKTRRWILLGYAAIIALAVVRVRSASQVFNATVDEPMHIACGLDWLRGVPYTAFPDNPPLTRILAALPAWIAGVPTPPSSMPINERGNSILYSGDYVRNIAEARLGNLLFLVIGIAAVGAWAARRFGSAAGLVAASLFAWLPPIRAHAGLATTDMAMTALFPLGLLLLERWLDASTPVRSAALGAAVGLGALSKFSFLMFFLIAAMIVIVTRAARREARASRAGVFLSLSVVALIVWAGYRFETGTLARAHPATSYLVGELVPPAARGAATWVARNVPIPAPLYVVGAAALEADDLHGHEAFLLGETRLHGWWYYFPVALFYKTPLPFLILASLGSALVLARERRSADVVLIPLVLLACLLPASIDIGVRHILPLYAPLAAMAGHAIVVLWRKLAGRLAAVALALWMAAGTEGAHPDYLPWFNETAGSHPERILLDSNLDWGQDYLRLAKTLNERNIDRVLVLLNGGTIRLENHIRPGISGGAIEPWKKAPGWYAVSETPLAVNPEARAGGYRWLEKYAYERIGKTIRLYRVGA
jgi:4-amino-4-deoxy-L-arabinose transferase-like glycosyltransferase